MKMVIENEIFKKKYIQMEQYLQEKLLIEKDMEKEHMYIKITINMWVIGKMMYLKEQEYTYLIMETIIMVI